MRNHRRKGYTHRHTPSSLATMLIALPNLHDLRTRIWFQHSLIILACVACYGSSLRGDFVFDDAVAIVRNADVTAPNRSLLAHILRHDFWGQNLSDPSSHKSFRPLTTLTFRWEHAAFGLQAAPMKLHNFLLHCAICCALLRLVPRLFPRMDAAAAFVAVALFAVHPVHTEAVAGVVGRAELLSAGGYVLALLVWTSGTVADWWRYSAVFALAALSLASKEVGVMVLPMCLSVDAVNEVWPRARSNAAMGWRRLGRRLRRLLVWRGAVLMAMTGALVVARLWAMDFRGPSFKVMDNPVAAAAQLKTRILSQNYLYALNAWLLLCPDWLSFDWALGSIELLEYCTDPRCAAIAALFAVLGSLLWLGRRDHILALALLCVPFVPASGLVRLGFVIAERVLYIPSIGYCALVAVGWDALLRHSQTHRHRRTLLVAATLLLLAVSGLRCRWRAAEWTDETALYMSALRVCPNNAKVHYNIAKMLADRGDRTNAVRFYEQAIALYPDYEVAYTNLGNLYREEHRLDLAERYLRKAIAIQEEFPPAWMNLGIVLAAQGKYDQALHSYRTALLYRPIYATCLYNIGNLHIAVNNETMALRYWSEAVAIEPQLTKAWANILAAHDNAGRTADVIRLSEIALRLQPNEPSVQFIRANALGKLSRFAEAEELYLQVVDARPDHALFYVNLGVLYHRWGKREKAMEAYRLALHIEPELQSARENLQRLQRVQKRSPLVIGGRTEGSGGLE